MAASSQNITNGLAAAAIGVLQLGVTISLAALIFAGPLADGTGRAATGFVLGTAIVSLVVGVSTRLSIVSAGAQDTAAVLVAAVAAAIVASPDLTAEQTVPTVIVMVAIAGVLTGLTFLLLATFGLTTFVRFLPFPVISGFTAGTGWLLFYGGVQVMRRDPLGWDSIGDLFMWSQFKFLIPGLALALTMLVIVMTDRLPNLLVSVAILSSVILFHAIGQSVSSLTNLEAQGWLIGPFDGGAAGWAPIGPSDIEQTNWAVLAENSLLIAAVVAVSVIGLLLNLSGLESGPDMRIDMNREMQAAGAANVLVGATGGLIGYHLIGDTFLARRLGARGRSAPIGVAVISAVAFLVGPDLIALVPRAVAGGVLAGVGISVLLAWTKDSLPRMSHSDQLLSGFILLVIAVFGVLPGVGVGVVAAAAVFVIKYSRTDPVRHVIHAAGRSRIDRHQADYELLAANRGAIVAFELQGYLFFGSTTGLRRQLMTRLEDAETSAVIVDFHHVTGVDSTAAAGLDAIAELLAERGVATVWSGIGPDLAASLPPSSHVANTAVDMDHGIAWCEELLIAAAEVNRDQDSNASTLFDADMLAFLDLPTQQIAAGETLLRAGDPGLDIFIVESGTLTAWLHRDGGDLVRIRQMLPGAVIGEIAFVTGSNRTATVIADSDAVLKVFSRQRFEAIAESHPEVAVEVQDQLLRRLGNRLTSSSQMVRDLLQ